MTKLINTSLLYILIFFNTNLLSNENNSEIKIGLLAPFSGEYKNLGNSLLFSTQLALDEINDLNIKIIPRDSGTNDIEKLNLAINEIIDAGANIIIGPTNYEDFDELKKYKNTIFISLSNKYAENRQNVISIGISLDSQLNALSSFLKKQKKTKTIVMYPKNQYTDFIDKKLIKLKFKSYKTFKYSSNPKILTGEIEKLTNYSQRKKNLELRKKLLEGKEDYQSKRELKKLEEKYTLGNVGFDSIVIIDFGNSLKSTIASLAFADVDDKKVLFTTVNQWFDKSIFYENSIKNLYYPSVNLKNFKYYNSKYFESFKSNPNEITMLSYDAIGLIYYIWKKNNGIKSINDFYIDDAIKGKTGEFQFTKEKVYQKLKIYRTADGKFVLN
jgi:hypothetical protein